MLESTATTCNIQTSTLTSLDIPHLHSHLAQHFVTLLLLLRKYHNHYSLSSVLNRLLLLWHQCSNTNGDPAEMYLPARYSVHHSVSAQQVCNHILKLSSLTLSPAWSGGFKLQEELPNFTKVAFTIFLHTMLHIIKKTLFLSPFGEYWTNHKHSEKLLQGREAVF